MSPLRLVPALCLATALTTTLARAEPAPGAAAAPPPEPVPGPPAAPPAAPAPETPPPTASAAAPAPEGTTPPPVVEGIHVAQPPLPPLEPRSRRYHDGFYLRLSMGLGALWATSKTDNVGYNETTTGTGGAIDVMAGGTPAPGLVVGG